MLQYLENLKASILSLFLILPTISGIRNLYSIKYAILTVITASLLSFSKPKIVFSNLKLFKVPIILIGINLLLKVIFHYDDRIWGRYFFEPIGYLIIIIHLLVDKKALNIFFLTSFWIFFVIFIIFLVSFDNYDAIRLQVFTLVQSTEDVIDFEYFTKSVWSKLDGFTLFSSTSLIFQQTILILLYAVKIKKTERYYYFYVLCLMTMVIFTFERLQLLTLLLFVFKDTIFNYRKIVILLWLAAQIIFFPFGFLDYRFYVPYLVIINGNILRFSSLGQYPDSWVSSKKYFDFEGGYDIVSHQLKTVSIHNHLFNFPLMYGFFGTMIFIFIIFLFNRLARKSNNPEELFFLLAQILFMTFHNDGIFFTPLSWMFYFAFKYSNDIENLQKRYAKRK